ncbi:MAG: 4-(cytidine 5'-diphospho)-2-C-methyl-D-erythritol kinase [Rhodobacter sp.]|nr:4-(cytidine 5'-diphospho)-2-C-methyl-D-erythritol kinase [Rhodobacter sp.]
MAIEAFAPAKVNLTLHVTGQRADGYHLLDSLVVFADIGDTVRAMAADGLSLTVTGPQAAGLAADDSNLVLRAARLFPLATGAALMLDKVLPVASGIGGGSADAAATLQVLSRLWGVALPETAEVLRLGADVPVCLAGRPVRMTGVGGDLHALAHPLPPAALVLANPGVALPTPAVFAALDRRDHAPMPRALPRLRDVAELAAFLAMMRNDLEPAATRLAPVIAQVRAALTAQQGCLLSRMSGSGATCFGLFPDPLAAAAAARTLKAAHPGWWVAAAPLRA